MPQVTVESCLVTARTMLNDDAATLWTDTVLMPKFARAHQELQTKLRFAGSPVMRAVANDNSVLAAAVTMTLPADFAEPIMLWEKAPGDPQNLYQPMTEADPLPLVVVGSILGYWQWYNNETINFLGSSANRYVRLVYWRQITIPTLTTSLTGFTNGELWLAPRTAALAAGSVGNDAVASAASSAAEAYLQQVISSNRGRHPAGPGQTPRP